MTIIVSQKDRRAAYLHNAERQEVELRFPKLQRRRSMRERVRERLDQPKQPPRSSPPRRYGV
jgi:hypothetical protein